MKKKLCLLLVGIMTISTLFTGCSFEIGTPSAEKLLENAFPPKMEYAEYDMSIVMDMKMNSEGMTMVMKAEAEYEVEATKDAVHMTGTTTAEVMGFEVNTEVESYDILDGKERYTYTYDNETDAWTYTVTDTKEKTCLPHFDMDAFDDLEMEKEDDEYIVTAVIDDLDAVAVSQGVAEEDGTDDSLADAEFNVTFVFGKDKEIKSYKVELDTESVEDSGAEMTYDELVVEIEFKDFEDDEEIKLPKDVKENATLVGDSDIEVDFENDDEDYEDDDYYEYPDNYEGEGYYGDAEDYYEGDDYYEYPDNYEGEGYYGDAEDYYEGDDYYEYPDNYEGEGYYGDAEDYYEGNYGG